jgi:hypothetical protein
MFSFWRPNIEKLIKTKNYSKLYSLLFTHKDKSIQIKALKALIAPEWKEKFFGDCYSSEKREKVTDLIIENNLCNEETLRSLLASFGSKDSHLLDKCIVPLKSLGDDTAINILVRTLISHATNIATDEAIVTSDLCRTLKKLIVEFGEDALEEVEKRVPGYFSAADYKNETVSYHLKEVLSKIKNN